MSGQWFLTANLVLLNLSSGARISIEQRDDGSPFQAILKYNFSYANANSRGGFSLPVWTEILSKYRTGREARDALLALAGKLKAIHFTDIE